MIKDIKKFLKKNYIVVIGIIVLCVMCVVVNVIFNYKDKDVDKKKDSVSNSVSIEVYKTSKFMAFDGKRDEVFDKVVFDFDTKDAKELNKKYDDLVKGNVEYYESFDLVKNEEGYVTSEFLASNFDASYEEYKNIGSVKAMSCFFGTVPAGGHCVVYGDNINLNNGKRISNKELLNTFGISGEKLFEEAYNQNPEKGIMSYDEFLESISDIKKDIELASVYIEDGNLFFLYEGCFDMCVVEFNK